MFSDPGRSKSPLIGPENRLTDRRAKKQKTTFRKHEFEPNVSNKFVEAYPFAHIRH